jgi:transposase
MIELTDKNVSGKVLDHLGLVASTIYDIGLVQKIDTRLPLSLNKGAKVTIGQRVAAMIINGLGFMNTRLYMFPEFLDNKPVDRLLGDGLIAEDFNDDALGRALDAIHKYGTNQLFSEIAFPIAIEQKLMGTSIHLDSSSLSVHGEYTEDEDSIKLLDDNESNSETLATTPRITHGFSKDHRPDLKQVVINIATTGAAGFPIMMESHSGNASDQKILYEAVKRMQKFCKGLNELPDFMYVADSAMYNSCVNNSADFIWMSRVPESISEAKTLLQKEDDNFAWKDIGDGYRVCTTKSKYKDIDQRWCVVSSEQAYKREIVTFEKNVIKDMELAEKALKKLSHQHFSCKQDATEALKKSAPKLKYHQITAAPIIIRKHQQNGRPKKGVLGNIAGYKLQGEVIKDTKKIDLARVMKGRFILATNQLNTDLLPDERILSEYKEQSKTESGFKFIKDNSFEVSSIFLKKPERVAALMMIMTLCLMVYSVAQYRLRESLKELNEHVPNQNGKLTQNPTIKRVFKLFQGVQVLTVAINDIEQVLVINLNTTLKSILKHFGTRAMEIYGLTIQNNTVLSNAR